VTRDLLKERERGAEAEFFQKRDAKLIAKIREQAHLDEVALALAEKLSVDDPALLTRVRGLGITRETGAAFLVLPMVQSAWADGEVSERERDVVLALAGTCGIVAGTPAHEQLLAWLRVRPATELFDAAIAVLRLGFGVLPAPERKDRIQAVVDACHRVAEANAGLVKFLGLSRALWIREFAVLDELQARLASSG